VKGKSNFSFRHTTTMKNVSFDIAWDNMLMNYTHLDEMAMNGTMPWRGASDKETHFFQILLEVVIVEGDLVLDCIASTSE